jgi:putative nucleotidyltransferase with HDIG domain
MQMQIPASQRLEHLLSMLETQRPQVAEHSRRVAVLAVRLASQYGLSPQAIDSIRVGALLHDVGKLFVAPHILKKSSGLSRSEWEELAGHPEVGVELADRAGAAHGACEIILYHHERYDGQGYPDRMASSAIPWPVRIVSVMDAFDALVYPVSPVRDPMSVEAARAFIGRRAGSQFCPWVVSGLLSLPASMLETGSTAERPLCIPDGLAARDVLGATEAFVPAL